MTQMNRRQFGLAAAAAAGVLAMPSILRAQARPRLVEEAHRVAVADDVAVANGRVAGLEGEARG